MIAKSCKGMESLRDGLKKEKHKKEDLASRKEKYWINKNFLSIKRITKDRSKAEL